MAAVMNDRVSIKHALQHQKYEVYLEARKVLSTSWGARYVLLDDNDKSIDPLEYRERIGHMMELCEEAAQRLIDKLDNLEAMISEAEFAS